MKNKKCQSVGDGKTLAAGWGCCKCNIYNGMQRNACRICNHARCGLKPCTNVNERNTA